MLKNQKRVTGIAQPKAGKAKKKVLTLKKLKKEVWDECRRIIRARYIHQCYTCGASNLEGSNLQTGHGKPEASLTLKHKYDLRNLRPQCLVCNLHKGGVSDIFISKLEKEKSGLAFLKESCRKVEEGYWKVNDYETMGSVDSRIFLQKLLEEYRLIEK